MPNSIMFLLGFAFGALFGMFLIVAIACFSVRTKKKTSKK